MGIGYGIDQLNIAEAALRKAIELQPAAARLHVYMTTIDLLRGKAQGQLGRAEDVNHPQFLRNLGKIFRRALETLCRRARDDFEVRNFRQTRQNFILNSLRKISVTLLSAEIVERQHGD